jgi:hypothetical protein
MYKFEMEAPIILETREDVIEELKRILSEIEQGNECGFIDSEIQCMDWSCCEDEEWENED